MSGKPSSTPSSNDPIARARAFLAETAHLDPTHPSYRGQAAAPTFIDPIARAAFQGETAHLDRSASSPANAGAGASSAHILSAAPTEFNIAASPALMSGLAFLGRTSNMPAAMAAVSGSDVTPVQVKAALADREGMAAVSKALHAPTYKADPSKLAAHFKMFETYITADNDSEAAEFIRAARAEGGDTSASILKVDDLLELANKKHGQLVEKIKALNNTIKTLKTDINYFTANPPRTPEAILAFRQKIDQQKQALDVLELIKPCVETANDIIIALNKCWTSMHYAASAGLVETMQALFDGGADIEEAGLTVTKWEYENLGFSTEGAAKYTPDAPDYKEVLRCLKTSKNVAKEEAKIFLDAIDSRLISTPILLASHNSHLEAIEWLLDHGAHFNSITAKHYLKRAEENHADKFSLLKWIIDHASIADDPHHQNFIEAFKNFLAVNNDGYLPINLKRTIDANDELKIIADSIISEDPVDIIGLDFHAPAA